MTDYIFKIRVNFLVASFVFLAAMAVYIFTLAPTIYLEDGGEFVTAAATLGIAHPSGYPLFVLIGKLFSFIPFGTAAWRVNLVSAFFGAMTSAMLYLIIERLTKKKAVAAATALVLAFSPIFWSQSVVAEVYTLNSFFVALLIYILLVWQERREDKYLLWFAFLYGLSLTNHTMMILLAPAFGLFIVMVDFNVLRRFGLILKMAALFFLGLLVYAYLPIRSAQGPILDWGDTDHLKNFWAHITRKLYGDFSPLHQEKSKLGLVGAFVYNLVYDFFWPTLFLALIGFYGLIKKNYKIGILTLGIFIFNSLGIIG
ncbi:MAG: DUF2723 domain-containing protein, partial [Patescibacteria group bacterium]